MDKDIVIIGNSSAARECYWMAREIWGDKLRFKGFLSFEGYPQKLRNLAHMELGIDDAYEPVQDDVFVIGIASPALRLKAYAKWKERGANFCNLVHPSSYIGESANVGEAMIVTANCHFSCDAVIGNANYFNGAVVVGHDVVIGDGNFFGPYALILGDTHIGSGNAFGVRSVVLAGANIGHNNIIAPGAYIYKGCRNGWRMAGNPAMRID